MTGYAKILSLGFSLPGKPIALHNLKIDPALENHLKDSGQEFTYKTENDSTVLALEAAKVAINSSGIDAESIDFIISAPTLLTSYGFEIPAVTLRAELGLNNAECMNISQGCTGILVALRMAEMIIRSETNNKNVLIVSACKSSTLIDQFTHGSFYWGDAAIAAVVSRPGGTGLHYCRYAEANSISDWGAMRLKHGDGTYYGNCVPSDDLRVVVEFPNIRAQADYISGEKDRCAAVIELLLDMHNLKMHDIKSVFFPSIGKNRVRTLLEGFPEIMDKVGTDFKYPHMGGVDLMFFVNNYLNKKKPQQEEWYIALTPAFTAQWSGILLNYGI